MSVPMDGILKRLAVVIPTTDWDIMLWRLELNLLGLCAQTRAPQEVVVVDSIGKTDIVAKLVNKFKDRLNIHAEQLPYSDLVFRTGGARNKGVESLHQDCDRILFLDADCVPFPKVVETHLQLDQPNLVLLGFRTHIKPIKAMVGNLELVYSVNPTAQDWRIRAKRTTARYDILHSHHFSVPKVLFNKVQGFWPCVVINEDVEFGYRCHVADGKFATVRNPKVRHIDHPIWRPHQPHNDVPNYHVSVSESMQIPGYLRETPDFLRW
jgi:hypothetical protein